MKRIVASIALCIATLLAADKAQAFGPNPPPPPGKKISRRTRVELQPHSYKQPLPAQARELDAGLYGEWYRSRFLWAPAEVGPLSLGGGTGSLDQMTEMDWFEPRRKGLFRYVRRRFLSYLKHLHSDQIKERWKDDPSFTPKEYAEARRALRESIRMNDLFRRKPTFQEVLTGRRPPRAARNPYVARVGAVRVDEDYRLDVDLDDLLGGPDSSEVAAEPARTPRTPSRRSKSRARRGRWFQLKVSPRGIVSGGRGIEPQDIVRNYGARVSLYVLPRRGRGPLFTSAARLKVTPRGEATLTIDLFKKRF